MSTEAPEPLEVLIGHLKRVRGTDFASYKPASLRRRIDKRLSEVGVDDLQAYVDYLEVHPDEFNLLFDTILINVTSFFRDPEAWTYMAEKILPTIAPTAAQGDELRLWSIGCASGEEAYTLAMLLCEELGEDAFKQSVKLFATDLDDDALDRARQGRYDERAIEPVPTELRDRYFEHSPNGWLFRGDLRRNLIFGRHDLTRDAPIRRVGLITCRNTLMYFDSEAQRTILARLHYALQDPGFIMLGRAESLFAHHDLFKVVSAEHRVFAKIPAVNARAGLLRMARLGSEEVHAEVNALLALSELAMDAAPAALLLIDAEGALVSANVRARAMFGLTPADIGRPFRDLEVSYRPVELRSLIDQARQSGKAIKAPFAQRGRPDGSAQHLEIEVAPLGDRGARAVCIVFADVTEHHEIQEDLLRSKHDLQTAYEELQSTNEELETTNEELQSSVEELETINEELQSTNEELETVNEELQSTNEELQTVNEELRVRTADLNRANALLEAILSSLESAVVVVDRDVLVVEWNAHAEDMWGVRSEEARDADLFTLDINLPVEELRAPIQAALMGTMSQPLELDTVNRKGQPLRCRIVVGPLSTPGDQIVGAILAMTGIDGA